MATLKIEEESRTGDTLEAQVSGDRLYVTCEQQWSGDTESGFGGSAGVGLTKPQARELAAFLLAWADTP